MLVWERRIHLPSPGLPELKMQLEHPTPGFVQARALEIFGDDATAAGWMSDPLPILDGRSPAEMVASGDPGNLRRVLEILISIDYGMFS
jgi:uncharacterized protein (DUF2384 family)